MPKINCICVNCGSNPGLGTRYRAAARLLGETLAERGITLVYGGADVGLMRELANAALSKGGRVIGVIPRELHAKVGHHGLTQLEFVASMSERKARMLELADAFIALPGGFGTLEELFEVYTWGQLGYHHKPCGLLNIEGYFDQLLAFIDHVVEQRFSRIEFREMMLTAPSPAELLAQFENYQAPKVEKWIDREK